MKYQSLYLLEPSLYEACSKNGKLQEMEKPDLVIVPNVEGAITQVRGRNIDSVFMYGVTREEIESKLSYAIQEAQRAAMFSGRPIEYLVRELK